MERNDWQSGFLVHPVELGVLRRGAQRVPQHPRSTHVGTRSLLRTAIVLVVAVRGGY